MEKLSEKQQKKGQSFYFLFCMFNGVAITFVAENILILYSLKLNIPDYIVGIAASFMFMSAPVMLLGRGLISKFGASKTISFAWVIRYMFALLFLVAPFLISTFSLNVGIAAILVGAFGFYASKGIGIVAWIPMLGEITTKDTRSKIISKGFFIYALFYFLALCTLRIVLEFSDTIFTFKWLIIIGSVIGLMGAYSVLKIPESSAPKSSASISLKSTFLYVLKYKPILNLIIIQTIYFSVLALVVPFSVLALKEGYGIGDYEAISYIIVQMSGGIMISIIINKIIGKISHTHIIVILFSLMLLSSFMWVAAPVNFKWWFSFFIFISLGMARMGGFQIFADYFLAITPEENRVGVNLVISIISSTTAGVIGAVVGGGLLRKLESQGYHLLSLYQHYFVIIFILLIIGFLIILYLVRINPIKTLLIARKIFIKKRIANTYCRNKN